MSDPTEDGIADAVRAGLQGHGTFSGGPEQLAALLLSCSGQYRSHPQTPHVVRRIGWTLTARAAPDFRAKLSLAVLRLAEGAGGAALSFIDELRLWATRPGLQGAVGVTHVGTDRIVAQYGHADATLAVNSELSSEDSDFPAQAITDAVSLVTAYVEDLTFESQQNPEIP